MSKKKNKVMGYAVMALLLISAGAIEAMGSDEFRVRNPAERAGVTAAFIEQQPNSGGAGFDESVRRGRNGGLSDDEFASNNNDQNHQSIQLQQTNQVEYKRNNHGNGTLSDDDGDGNEIPGSGNWSPPHSQRNNHSSVPAHSVHCPPVSGVPAGSSYNSSSHSYHTGGNSFGPLRIFSGGSSSSFSPPMNTPSAPSVNWAYTQDEAIPDDFAMRIGRNRRSLRCGMCAPLAVFAVIAIVSLRALFGKKKQPSHQYRPRQRPPRKGER